MKLPKFSLIFKKDGTTLARLITLGAVILAIAFITFAVTFVLDTLTVAFTVPTTAYEKAPGEEMLLSPELIDRVGAAQAARLVPGPVIRVDLYDPFAPVVVPPTPPPATPAPEPAAE